LDAIAPAVFIGQALARPANFINQELFGQPTTLPWGIKINPSQPYQTPTSMVGHSQQEVLDYIKVTRFHPTFAYEMILNILLALLLLWVARQYKDKIKSGTIFSVWLALAGLARAFIENFRPDQPKIGNSFVSYTMLVSFLMAIVGAVMLLIRNRKLAPALADSWPAQYQVKRIGKEPRVRREKAVAKGEVVAVMETASTPELNQAVAETVPLIPAAVVPEKKKRVVKTKPIVAKKPVTRVKAKAPAKKVTGKKAPVQKKPAAKARPAVKKIPIKKAPVAKKPVAKAKEIVKKPLKKKVPAKDAGAKSKTAK